MNIDNYSQIKGNRGFEYNVARFRIVGSTFSHMEFQSTNKRFLRILGGLEMQGIQSLSLYSFISKNIDPVISSQKLRITL
jgi:hypothetical protein